MNWYLAVFKKYAVFSGRAQRMEYWMFALFNFIISIVLYVIDGVITGFSPETHSSIFQTIYGLAVFVPSLAVSVRRLHDTGRSGWWILLCLVPIIGWIVILIFFVQDSQAGENQYGPNPKEEIVAA